MFTRAFAIALFAVAFSAILVLQLPGSVNGFPRPADSSSAASSESAAAEKIQSGSEKTQSGLENIGHGVENIAAGAKDTAVGAAEAAGQKVADVKEGAKQELNEAGQAIGQLQDTLDARSVKSTKGKRRRGKKAMDT